MSFSTFLLGFCRVLLRIFGVFTEIFWIFDSFIEFSLNFSLVLLDFI